MKKYSWLLIALICITSANAQTKVEQLKSKKLNETRDIQLYIPEG